MRHIPIGAALSFGLLVAAPGAQAATFIFAAPLLGTQEVPPVTTTGSGFAVVTIDDLARTMRVESTFANLTGTTTIAHIHCCAPLGTNAAPATTVPSFPGFPTGITAGSFDQTYDMTLASSYNPAFVTASGGTADGAFSAFLGGLQSEQAYFNIHTSAFGGGEIRGQLSLVPEPASWAMMVLGFGVIGGAVRSARQKRKLTVAYA